MATFRQRSHRAATGGNFRARSAVQVVTEQTDTTCGTISVVDPNSGTGGGGGGGGDGSSGGSTPEEDPTDGGSDTPQQPSGSRTLPFIGELSADNPRALAAGAGGVAFLALISG